MRVETLTLGGLAAFISRKNLPVARVAYTELVGEVLAGHVAGAFDASGPFIIGGVQRLDDETGAAWFSATRDKMAGQQLAVIRAIWRGIAIRGFKSVVAFVSEENANGHRLARLAGFERSGRSVLGLAEYVWRGGDERHCRGYYGERAAQAGAPDGVGTSRSAESH